MFYYTQKALKNAVWLKKVRLYMKSKTLNPSVLIISLLIFNGTIIGVVRPFNLLGISVMIGSEIAVVLATLWVLRKYSNHRTS